MKEERLVKEIRKDAVRAAIIALEQVADGEVWLHPGNSGDLGNLYVDDEFICSVRTYESSFGPHR